MSKNWSKIVLVSVLALMVAASMSFATTTRVHTLANTGDYLSDDSNAQRWYSVLPMYGNQVNAEVGSWSGSTLSDTRGLAWTVTCGEDGGWGTYRIALNENAVDHPGFYSANPFFMMHTPGTALAGLLGFGGSPTGIAETPINTYDISGGWEVGEDVLVGVSLTYSSWKYESTTSEDDTGGGGSTEDTVTDLKGSLITLGAGATWTDNDGLALDVTGTLAFSNVEGTEDESFASGGATFESAIAVEDDHSTAFDFAARLFWDWTDNTQIVPVFEFSKSEYVVAADGGTTGGLTDDMIATTIGAEDKYFKFGVGLNVDVNSGNTLIFAAEFARHTHDIAILETVTPDVDNPEVGNTEFIGAAELTMTYMPMLRLALESDITSWMTFRIGAAKAIGKDKVEGADSELFTNDDEETGTFDEEITPGAYGDIFGSSIYSNMFDWFLGVGFNVAEWTIDMELADETPFSVGYWITGYENWGSQGPVARISAVYNY